MESRAAKVKQLLKLLELLLQRASLLLAGGSEDVDFYFVCVKQMLPQPRCCSLPYIAIYINIRYFSRRRHEVERL